ncbi:MAG: hypothetical protein PVH19_15270 [Planctomycetia bacterium]|jgi:hypothetical protein
MLLLDAFAFAETVLPDFFAVVVLFFEAVAVLLARAVVERFEAVVEDLDFDLVVDLLFAFVGLFLLLTFEGVIFRPLVLLPAVAFGELFAVVLFFLVTFLADALVVFLVDLVVFLGLVLATDNLLGSWRGIRGDSHRRNKIWRGGRCICRVERSSVKIDKLKQLGNLAKTNGLRKASGQCGRNCQAGYTNVFRFLSFIPKDLLPSVTITRIA